ncbi:MAG: Protein of unknown function (DUF1587)/Protein of unknown function (DUF1592)/Protein of unknown [Pedosphaera sp.]|nr:Protein of unknown function (DUF1587)/Protein of unknown function (DUF1592)/Protein of unknown [Pedosphaera sp.]
MALRWVSLMVLMGLGLETAQLAALADGVRKAGAGKSTFEANIKPLLTHYCFACHGEKKKGDLDLRLYGDEDSVKKNPAIFEKVLDNIERHEMPPEDRPQPSASERKLISQWIELDVLQCDCNHPDPGRVTIRRLNRAEYNNTIHDLLGVDFKPAQDFPADDIGYGFDNIGDVLSLSPMLMEKYLSAAGKIMDLAIVTEQPVKGPVKRFNGADMPSTAKGGDYGISGRILYNNGEVTARFQCSKAGEYLLRARAFGQQAGPEPVRLEFRVNSQAIKEVKVAVTEASPEVYEVRVDWKPGDQQVSLAFINDYYRGDDPNPNNRDRNMIIDYLEVLGPIEVQPPPEPNRYVFQRQSNAQTTDADAQEIIANFARRAYRRPVTQTEVERLFKIFEMVEKDGGSFEAGIKLALQAVLVSPNFLFRGELQPEPDNPKSVHPINEYALASRLSYFLWSTMPDDELFALAAKGKLRSNLEGQVARMLKDPKAHAVVQNFADQWLQIRNLATVTPDKEAFPEFDEELRSAMAQETDLFFESIMKQDRSILEFIEADYTFLNERLARHYGISGVQGSEFRRVSLKSSARGGLLTQASILTVTSTPTRTSPVKRGKWVLENILGTPPPPPLPNVPSLKEGKELVLTGTLRQRLEQHRADPACANCHARMDPIGFGFENFDGIGAWRNKDGEFPLDTTGQLLTGESFNGPVELRSVLLKGKRDQFVRCLSEKMLTYALGRGLERYDRCAVDQISKNLARNHYKFSSLIIEVVKSNPFQMRRGEEHKLEQASVSSGE